MSGFSVAFAKLKISIKISVFSYCLLTIYTLISSQYQKKHIQNRIKSSAFSGVKHSIKSNVRLF